MPPHRSKHPSHAPKHPPRPPSPRVAEHVDRQRLDALLARWVPDAHDRAFVARCLADEGPAHHRGSTFALLTLLDRVLQKIPEGAPAPPDAGSVRVPLRLPPHVAEGLDPGDDHYPVAMPTRAIRAASDSPREADAMIDCLTDGPPHHALANALLVVMLDEALRRLGGDA
ncbi:MAG: hypothetical protein R3A48_22750 [Polyangiales bacterium]